MSDKPIAVVTGASSGIGEGYAIQLAKRGYDLVIAARRVDRLEKLARDLRDQHGIAVEVMVADLSDAESTREFAKHLSERDRIDCLINSAGFGSNGAYDKLDPSRIEQELYVDLVALALLNRAVLPGMLARGKGDIVNIASLGGLNPTPFFVPYSAAKAGVVAFSQALYGEVRDRGVHVQVMCPGPVPTEFNEVSGVEDMPTPDFMLQSAEDCVAIALRHLDQKKPVSIPQKYCRWIFSSIKFLPLAVRLAMFEKGLRKE